MQMVAGNGYAPMLIPHQGKVLLLYEPAKLVVNVGYAPTFLANQASVLLLDESTKATTCVRRHMSLLTTNDHNRQYFRRPMDKASGLLDFH